MDFQWPFPCSHFLLLSCLAVLSCFVGFIRLLVNRLVLNCSKGSFLHGRSSLFSWQHSHEKPIGLAISRQLDSTIASHYAAWPVIGVGKGRMLLAKGFSLLRQPNPHICTDNGQSAAVLHPPSSRSCSPLWTLSPSREGSGAHTFTRAHRQIDWSCSHSWNYFRAVQFLFTKAFLFFCEPVRCGTLTLRKACESVFSWFNKHLDVSFPFSVCVPSLSANRWLMPGKSCTRGDMVGLVSLCRPGVRFSFSCLPAFIWLR